jgi:anti-sigma-K factor RskA
MNEAEDIDALAAEYALGTLPATERTSVALRARSEPSLAAAIEAWERRLGPLAETVAAREVPANVWREIEARIDARSAAPGNVVDLRNNLRRWKAATFAASAIAASLLALLLFL